MVRRHAIAAALLLAAPLCPLAARADVITLGLQEAGTNGGAITTETSSGGSLTFSGSYGTFMLNNITATGSPFLPEPNFDTSSLNVTGAGTLYVYVTESGLTTVTGPLTSAFTSNLFNGGAVSVVETTLLSTSNTLFAGAALATATFTGQSTSNVVTAPPTLSGPYSLTAEYKITATGSGDVNDTIDLSGAPAAVPEPTSVAVLGSALLGAGFLGFMARRRG